MVRNLLPSVPYVSFDEPNEELAFHDDPRGFMARFPGQAIFDEVQRVPDLFRYLKIAIDAEPERMGRFILTGSNQLSFQKNISESLAGRIGLLCLLPFEHSELPQGSRQARILGGGYPALVMRNFKGAREWFSSYIGTYLEKDVKRIFDIGKLTDFQILLRLLAARTSQELNASSLARELGVSANTVNAWISVLEAGYIVFSLRPLHANLGKRLIKRPKVFFWDTGLACHLSNVRDMESLSGGPLAGPIFENAVIAEILKRNFHGGHDRDYWFYRDNSGNEIDLIEHDKEKRVVTLIEIKASFTAKTEWTRLLERTAAWIKSAFPGVTAFAYRIVYQGETKLNWPKPGFDFFNMDEMP